MSDVTQSESTYRTGWSRDWLLMTPSCRSTSGSRCSSVTSRLRRDAPASPFALPGPAEMTSSHDADAGCRAWNDSKQSWRMKASGLAWQPLLQLPDACWLWTSSSTQQFDNNNLLDNLCHQGRSQEFAKGGDKPGGLGDGSPPAGSRGRVPVGVWGQSPQKPETNVDKKNKPPVWDSKG